MQQDTRKRIAKEALRLFSENGYGSTSVSEIAAAVGIKAPSLYNHFNSKQDIFDSIVAEMTERFAGAAVMLSLPAGDAILKARQYAAGGVSYLKEAAYTYFHYYLTDESASRFRKMLSIERHSNPDMGRLYNDIFIDAPVRYQAEIFSELIKEGKLKPADPQITALQFAAPMLLMLEKYADNIEDEPEAKELIRMHIEAFCSVYERQEEAETGI